MHFYIIAEKSYHLFLAMTPWFLSHPDSIHYSLYAANDG